MFDLPLIKHTMKENRKIWGMAAGILLLLLLLVIGLYSPQNEGRLLKVLPEKFSAFLAMKMADDSLNAYLAARFYGLLCPAAVMVYGIAVSQNLMVKQVESGVMAWLLSSKDSRGRIAATQAYFLSVSLFGLYLMVTLAGAAACAVRFPGKLSWLEFLLLNMGGFCLSLCLAGISFCISCFCDDSTVSLRMGAGISALFLLLRLVSNLGGILTPLRFVTVFTLFDTEAVMEGEFLCLWKFPVLAILGILLMWLGVRGFEKRDLPL